MHRPTAALRAQESTIVDIFRTARAVTGARARKLRDLGLKPSRPLQRLLDTAVLRRAGLERYFLDEGAWANRRSLSVRALGRLILAAAACAVIALLWLR